MNNHGGLAAVLAVFVVAPSALLLLPNAKCPPDTAPYLGFWRERVVSAYVTGGVAFSDDTTTDGALHSENVEIMWNGVFAEFRSVHLYLPDHRALRSMRAGYLIHPSPILSGGITVGYREAPGHRIPKGLEISLPIMGGARHPGGNGPWLRWEPTYIISRERVSLSPRMRFEFPLRWRSLVAGVDLEVNGVRKGDLYHVALLLAVRP